MSLFKHIEGFNAEENWGNPLKMNGFLIMLMMMVRKIYRERYDPDARFYIHCGYDLNGHAPASEHYKGNADDFHIETSLSFSQQVHAIKQILAELQVLELVGLGIYPEWNNPGFHLDVRMKIGRWSQVGGAYVSLELGLEKAKEIEAA